MNGITIGRRLAALTERLRWTFKIGWQYEASFPWLHSFSHRYRNRKTGEIKLHHDPC